MVPGSRLERVIAIAALLVGGLLVLGFIAAAGWTGYCVDVVPGGDAGLATSPELEAGRTAVELFGSALLGLGVATAVVLLIARRRRRVSGRR